MVGPAPPSALRFQAAVERPISVVFRRTDGRWEGHDYRVEVLTERQGLDAFDVVMDFRVLEAALDALLAPMEGQLLSELGMTGPLELARQLLAELSPKVPAPAHLVSVALTDVHGRRLTLRS
jgi:6-pyruvoyl-tetrahydropterin synthase